MKTGLIAAVCLASTLALARDVPYVGMVLGPVGEELAAYLQLSGGARVVAVDSDSPAAKAGIASTDIVTTWNGADVTGPEDLVKKVKATKPGETVTVTVLRLGKKMELTVTVGTRAETPAKPEEKKQQPGFLGIGFHMVPPEVAEYLELGKKPGVVVREVLKDTPAAKAGLKKRDILRAVNGKPVANPEAFARFMGSFHEGDVLKIDYIRAGRPETVEVRLAARPKEMVRIPPEGPRTFHLHPRIEQGSGKIILRWRDAQGKEHEEVIRGPFEGFPDRFDFDLDFDFQMPDLGFDPEGIKRHIEESMKKAKKHFERFSEKVQKKHEEARGKLHSGVKIEALPGSDSRTVVVKKSTAFVTSNDGEYEISIRIEDDTKTVSVKKGDAVLAEDLPFEKIDTLPEDVQKKIKELEKGIDIEVKSIEVQPAPDREGEKEENLEIDVPTEKI